MTAIYKKELRSYFTSMTGYICMAFMLVVIGIYFAVINLSSGYPYFGYTLSCVIVLFLLMTPVLTMRILAEEKKPEDGSAASDGAGFTLEDCHRQISGDGDSIRPGPADHLLLSADSQSVRYRFPADGLYSHFGLFPVWRSLHCHRTVYLIQYRRARSLQHC